MTLQAEAPASLLSSGTCICASPIVSPKCPETTKTALSVIHSLLIYVATSAAKFITQNAKIAEMNGVLEVKREEVAYHHADGDEEVPVLLYPRLLRHRHRIAVLVQHRTPVLAFHELQICIQEYQVSNDKTIIFQNVLVVLFTLLISRQIWSALLPSPGLRDPRCRNEWQPPPLLILRWQHQYEYRPRHTSLFDILRKGAFSGRSSSSHADSRQAGAWEGGSRRTHICSARLDHIDLTRLSRVSLQLPEVSRVLVNDLSRDES